MMWAGLDLRLTLTGDQQTPVLLIANCGAIRVFKLESDR